MVAFIAAKAPATVPPKYEVYSALQDKANRNVSNSPELDWVVLPAKSVAIWVSIVEQTKGNFPFSRLLSNKAYTEPSAEKCSINSLRLPTRKTIA